MKPLPLLTRDDVPTDDPVESFALSFNGDDYWGSPEEYQCVAALVEGLRSRPGGLGHCTVAQLRTAIAREQRAMRHMGASLNYADVVDLLDALREKLPPTYEQRSAGVDPLIQHCFGAMVEGIQRNQRLLATLMPRVAPESSVVAAATEGLWSFQPRLERGYQVHLEGRASPSAAGKRVDIVVRPDEPGAPPLCIEWKVFWPNGSSECVKGIRADLAKLGGFHGLVMVFAYRVESVPPGHELRKSAVQLADALGSLEAAVGAATLRSELARFDIRDAKGEYQVLGWVVEAAGGHPSDHLPRSPNGL